jgi:hypothetical protein
MLSPDAKPFVPARKVSPMTPAKSRAVDNPHKLMKKIFKIKPRALVIVDVASRLSVATRTESKAIAELECQVGRANIFTVHIRDPPIQPMTLRDESHAGVSSVYVNRARIESWIIIVAMQISTRERYIEYLSICACHADRSMLRDAIKSTNAQLTFAEYDYELDPSIAPIRKQRMLILPPTDLGISRAHCILNNPRNANLSVELSWLLSALIPTRIDTVDDFIATWGIARTPSDYDDDARILRTLCAIFLMLDSLDPDFPFDDRAISREIRVYFRGRRDDFPANIPTYAPLTATERAMIIARNATRITA